jgi:hypothetical protein
VIYVLSAIPWLFIAAALTFAILNAVGTGTRTGAVGAGDPRALGWAGDIVRGIGDRYRSHVRFRAFNRARAQFRRHAPVCRRPTMDDAVETPHDRR